MSKNDKKLIVNEIMAIIMIVVYAFTVPSYGCCKPNIYSINNSPNDFPMLMKSDISIKENYIPDEFDAECLAKMAWGESRGTGDRGIEATMWCVMHRYDTGKYDSIYSVVSKPHQFVGYKSNNPVDDHILEIAKKVLKEHHNGEEPLLPNGYLWFTGDGVQNTFTDANGNKWRVN